MITARDAKKMTLDKNKEVYQLSINLIEKRIKAATQLGETKISSPLTKDTPHKIKLQVYEELKTLGYKVESSHDPRDQTTYTTISW